MVCVEGQREPRPTRGVPRLQGGSEMLFLLFFQLLYPCHLLHQSARATLTKDHRLGAQTTEMYFVIVLEPGSPRSSFISSRAFLLGLQMPLSHCVLTWFFLGVSASPGTSSSSSFFFFLNGYICSICKFLGQGLNPSRSCELCSSCSNAGFLTYCAMSGTPLFLFL